MKTIHNFNEVFDGQKVFRKILDAMSRPGKIVDIHEEADKMWGENKAFLAIAMTLIDNQVSFNACEEKELTEEIETLTLAKKGELSQADFIFVAHQENLSKVIKQAKSGVLSDPHKGATIIIKADDVFEETINIHGPGVDGVKAISVPVIVAETLKIRDSMQYEYPEGIDLIFVTPTARVFCLPRLIRMEG